MRRTGASVAALMRRPDASFSSYARQAPLVAAAAAAALVICLFPPERAAALLLATAAVSIVLAKPRFAYYLLPLTVPWGSAFPLSSTSQVTISDVVVAALVLHALLSFARTRHVTLSVTPWTISAMLLLLAMALSATQAMSLTLSAKEIIKWVELISVAVLAPAYLRPGRDIWIVVATTIAGGFTEALLGLYQFAFHVGPQNFEIYGRFLRAYGTFGQPNPLAGYLNIVLPIAVATAWVTRRASVAAAATVIALGSLVTFSRAGWAAAALGVGAVLVLLSPRFRPWPALAALAVAVAGLLASFSLIPTSPFLRLASAFGVTGINFNHYTTSNFSEMERAAHWVAGLRMFEHHPLLGVGIGNYPLAYPAYHVGAFTNALGHAHNYFINIAAEAGIIGLATYALFTYTGIWYALTIAREHGSSNVARMLAVGLVGAWISSTFHNLFDVLYVHAIPTLLGVLMGALAVAGSRGGWPERHPAGRQVDTDLARAGSTREPAADGDIPDL